MNHYDVTIRETLEVKMKVAANSREEDEQFARDQWKRGEVVLDASHFTGVEFHGLLGGTPLIPFLKGWRFSWKDCFLPLDFCWASLMSAATMRKCGSLTSLSGTSPKRCSCPSQWNNHGRYVHLAASGVKKIKIHGIKT